MLTKKHFEEIASIIKVNTHTSSFPKDKMVNYISTWAVVELMNYFKEINPRFDAEKFERICSHNIS